MEVQIAAPSSASPSVVPPRLMCGEGARRRLPGKQRRMPGGLVEDHLDLALGVEPARGQRSGEVARRPEQVLLAGRQHQVAADLLDRDRSRLGSVDVERPC